MFGAGTSIPVHNVTRWNSLNTELKSIVSPDNLKLADLLRDQLHSNLVLTSKEHVILVELITILDPFAKITQLMQGESYPTIGCVVHPIVKLENICSS